MDNSLYGEIIAVAALLVYAMAIVSALEAILKARTPQGAIAWAISLLTFPLLTLPLYLVFGRNRFDGYLEQRDIIEAEALRLTQQTSADIQHHIVPATPDNPLYTGLYNLARMPATTGNQVDLLVNGQATFDSIFTGLASAENYILFQYYIIRDDDLGKRLCRVLSDKARAGVKVFMLYDEIGSRPFSRSRLCEQLKMTGVHVAPFNTTQGRRNRFQLNFRNHRKVVVVDGKEAWIGGLNVGDEYLGLKKSVGHWRDTHTRLQGPAVQGAVVTFATDWHWATHTKLEIDWDFSGYRQGNSQVLVFPSDPASVYEEAGLMFHQIIVAAQRRIWIASPYFVPDRAIISALQLAALRGVDVRLIIPDEPDKKVVALANWSYTCELVPVGIKVYRYQGGFMHQKVLLMDDQIAGVGTANFDNRSFRLNFEVTLLVEDVGFASQVEKMLVTDMKRCHKVTAEDVRKVKKNILFALGMAVALLFTPVL